jgi:hypothetical protein
LLDIANKVFLAMRFWARPAPAMEFKTVAIDQTQGGHYAPQKLAECVCASVSPKRGMAIPFSARKIRTRREFGDAVE